MKVVPWCTIHCNWEEDTGDEEPWHANSGSPVLDKFLEEAAEMGAACSCARFGKRGLHFQHVWLLGEGDLSFSVAAAKLFPEWRMFCTTLEHGIDPPMLYRKSFLEGEGHEVEFGIEIKADSPSFNQLPPSQVFETRLSEHGHDVRLCVRIQSDDGTVRVLPLARYRSLSPYGNLCGDDRMLNLIVFNFPYVARNPLRTAILVQDFLRLVTKTATPGTEILLGLATQRANTDTVRYQYGYKSAEQLVAEIVIESHQAIASKGPTLVMQCSPDHCFYNHFEDKGYVHAADGHACWGYNAKTAFLMRVNMCEQSCIRTSLTSALDLLLKGCLDRAEARVFGDSYTMPLSERVENILNPGRQLSHKRRRLSGSVLFG